MNKPPNILFIMTDQQRGDCLGVDGHPCLQTPNMDALAADGVRFRRAYSTCPVCIPARRSLMTGLHPDKHGVVGWISGQDLDAPTLPQLLRDAGYQTGLVGRHMDLHPPRKRYGFEEMTIATSADNDYDEFIDRHAPEGGGYSGSGVRSNDWTARTWHLPEHLHRTNWITNEALRFLRRRDPSRPWFLTVSYQAPHPPLTPPEFYFNRYLRAELPAPLMGDWAEKPKFIGGAPQLISNRIDLKGEALLSGQAAYYGLINHIDDQIRRLLSTQGKVFDPEKTLVIFTSDHGEMLGDHYFFMKSLPYEGAARIPFFMRLPNSWKNAARGEVNDLPVCLEDIMPTLLDAAGVAIPDGINGQSLLPVLQGEEMEGWRDDLHIECGERIPFHAMTDGREKYIWFSQDGREQFFDLQTDSSELHDLSASLTHQNRIAQWRNKLIQTLDGRPEDFVQNEQLVAGQPHTKLIPAQSEFSDAT